MRILVTILGLAATATTFAKSPQKEFEVSEPQIIGVLFYADWCSACKVQVDFINQPVLFTRFDLTNLSTQFQAATLANQLGLSRLYKETGLKTGFMKLIDPKTGNVVETISRSIEIIYLDDG